MKPNIILTLAAFVCIACESGVPTCAIRKDWLLKNEGNKIFQTSEAESGSSEYRDKGKDSLKGGYYSFYSNGSLKEYNFLVSSNQSSYTEQFDSLGYLMYEKGSPLVFKSAELLSDSLILSFYFLALNKKYGDIKLFLPRDSSVVQLKLKTDTLFSNMKSVRYVIQGLDKAQDVDVYLTFNYLNNCTMEKKQGRDSVSLRYSPL